MLNATFRPIVAWPGAETAVHKRKSAPFRAGYTATLDLLESELSAIHAKDVIVQVHLTRNDIRNDGWPKASARPSKPGVILTFEKGKETVSMPCDRFQSWEDNLRAIALSLESLRRVDRYGVTRNGEQYRGFMALPPPAAEMSPDEASQILAQHSTVLASRIILDRDACRLAYREAARATHPDRNDGHDSLFLRVSAAKETLDRYFWVTR